MRVALLTRRLDGMPTNGFERYAHNLDEGLREQDVEIVLPLQRSPLSVRPSGSLISPPYYDVLLPLFRLMQGRMDADVVHALTDSQALYFPFIRGRKVLTLHHVDKIPPGSAPERIFNWFYSKGTGVALRFADHFICVSDQTKQEVMESYGIPADKITVVPHAISSRFRPQDMKKEGWTVGYMGALKKRKNLEVLIRAFTKARASARIRGFRLVICGEGPDEILLKQLARELGDDVEFRGLVPEDRLVDTYRSFDVFAFPSLQEGFGFPILEAQSCGIPVLTLEEAMVPEEVTRFALRCDGEAGLAEAMVRLHEDPTLYARLREDGLRYAANFSIEAMARRTLEVYRRVNERPLTRQAQECGPR